MIWEFYFEGIRLNPCLIKKLRARDDEDKQTNGNWEI